MERELEPVLITGTANPKLAEDVANILGWKLIKDNIERLKDNEARAQIQDNVRRREVFIIQPTCPPLVDEHYAELFALIDASYKASARRITAVVPYFGYSRQERKDRPRTSITGSLRAKDIIENKANAIMTIDLHAEGLQGAVREPWDNLYASYAFVPYLNQRLDLDNSVVVSPDIGGAPRATYYSELLNIKEDVAIVYKRRNPYRANQSEIVTMIGEVQGKDVLIVDDMVDTAGTLVAAAKLLKEKGAQSVRAAITHGLFSGNALDDIQNSSIETLFITDTIPLKRQMSKIEVVTIAPLLAEALRCNYTGDSLSEKLFPKPN